MQKVNTEDSFQGKKHTIEIQIKMWRYKYKKYKAKQADIIKLVGQSESLAGLSESLAGLSDLGSNLPRLTTWVGRVLLYPVSLWTYLFSPITLQRTDFVHKCLISSYNGNYYPKSSTRLFMFGNLLKFHIHMTYICTEMKLKCYTPFRQPIAWFSSFGAGSLV